ncbi:uncharacterized protein LOC131977324 isoform X2 [Centropristis striata]|uniref:uncharacterized protein LOC131977324 isoform X2 n=1 Tax=Centropristis striata TaxID=184440 RepID=UPI0027E17324|nr:uncharacterized protein LOC131977324 isoform X2 [Centropristis striata]
MVRPCVFPGCTNKEAPWSPYRFHRVPFTDVGLQWLLVLNIDLNTPPARVRQLRVCSVHFSEEDYLKPQPNKLDRHLLKSTAVPSHQLHDTGEEMDGSPDEVKGPGNQANVSETCATTTEKPTLQHIVDEEAIMQLMKNCPMCDRKCRCNKRTQGPYFIVYQSCYFCNYQRKWANQPEARNMNIYNSNKPKPKKPKPKDKVSGNAKAQSSQTNKTSISESSVSDSHDPSET